MSFVTRALQSVSRIALTPLNAIKEKTMGLVIKVVLQKFLGSLLKGGTAALVAFLTAGLSGLPHTEDKVVLAIIASLTALVHAAISGLKRLAEFDIAKVIK